MRFPDSQRTLRFDLPVYNPAVCIAREQTAILSHKLDAVYLGGVASKYIARLGWRKGGGLAINCHQ